MQILIYSYAYGNVGETMEPNTTTKVNTRNGEYTIVASVRMHSDGGHRGVEEDKMTCLAVNNRTGELVSWDTYWVEDYSPSVTVPTSGFGWCGGYYCDNAIPAFKKRIKREVKKCIARAERRQEKVLKAKEEVVE
tara:strand:+ start:1335 stop:1739 length:405 start_codon:yes stop_codon:yes gene_type:complete